MIQFLAPCPRLPVLHRRVPPRRVGTLGDNIEPLRRQTVEIQPGVVGDAVHDQRQFSAWRRSDANNE